MLNILDRVSDAAVKFSRDIINIFMFGLLTIGILFGNVDILNNNSLINQILISCFANYLLSYMFSYYIIKKTFISLKIRFILPMLATCISLGSIILFMGSLTIGLKIGVLILNLILWLKGIGAVSYDDDYKTAKNRFALNIIVLLSLTMINFFMQNFVFIYKITEVYLPIYFIIQILYFARSSLLNAYRGKNINTINMTRNVRIFNIISSLITLTILLLIMTNFFGAGDFKIVSGAMSFILKVIEKVLRIVFYPVLLLLSKVAQLVSKKLDKYSDLFEKTLSSFGDRLDSRHDELFFIENPIVNLIFVFIKWTIFAVLVFFILFFIFRKMKDISPYKVDEIEEGEEKDFVLTIKNVKHILNKRVKNLISKIVNRKTNDLGSLHIIRRLYIEVILKLNKKGYRFERCDTPNEYLSNIDDNRYVNAGLNKLTQYYNEVRYGRKEIKSSSIAECVNIKANIDKIE